MGEAKRKAKLNSNLPDWKRESRFDKFVEAVTGGKSYLFRPSVRPTESMVTYLPAAPELIPDFEGHSYDFGSAFSDNGCQSLSEVAQEHVDALRATGDLRLPHSTCFFIFTSSDADVVVVRAHNTDSGNICFAYWYYLKGTWYWHYVVGLYSPPLAAFDIAAESHCPEEVKRFCAQMASATLRAVALLSTRPEDEVIEEQDIIPALGTTRAKRTSAAHPTRLVRIRTFAVSRLKAITQRQTAERIGSPRCPHNRRGHERVYKKTGKRIWINETKIKGGSPIPRPAVVQVLH